MMYLTNSRKSIFIRSFIACCSLISSLGLFAQEGDQMLGEEITVNERVFNEDKLPPFPKSVPQLYNQFLISVDNLQVETELGHLPSLPRYVKGHYNLANQGPMVRVLWPFPKDNADVLKPGVYTITGSIPGSDLKCKATVTVVDKKKKEIVEKQVASFALEDVELRNNTKGQATKFQENRNKFIEGLAKTNPDDFLYMFRNAFGQTQPEGAKPLGGWDSQETKLRGHATGHYLTAIAQAYASCNDMPEVKEQFSKKMTYLVEVLYELANLSGRPTDLHPIANVDPTKVPPVREEGHYASDLTEDGIRNDYWNWGKGFISAYPPDQFILLEKGAIYGTDDDRIWAPYYTLHKILTGLLDIYEISGNEKAINVASSMADWVHARLSILPTETLLSMWNRYIAGEYGGMNETLARLSRLTGNFKYFETAKLFDNIRLFYGNENHEHGLAKNVDLFRGLHSNQHIPQILGALETYAVSKQEAYYHIANNFWYKTTNDYAYAIGGVAGAHNPANAECFVSEPGTLYENGLSADGQNETCATYNMLKLTKGLFKYNQNAKLFDYYERGLYNHILASVDEYTAANTYHVPLNPGAIKQFGNAEMSGFTCCNGTALESNTKFQEAIYFKSIDNKAIYVNLFIPSRVNWKERNVVLEQSTSFPNEDQTNIRINGRGKFTIHLRLPSWAKNGYVLNINEKEHRASVSSGSYISINRKWKDGDVINLKMPFSFYLQPLMDQQNVASVFYGPILLAAEEDGPRNSWRTVKLDKNDIAKSISTTDHPLRFKIGEVAFKPFYDSYGYHSVYLNIELE